MASNSSGSDNGKEVADELRKEIQAMRKNLKQEMFRSLSLIEAAILQNLRKNSGLHVRSGALLNSIGASKKLTEESDGTVTGQIGSQGIPYAAIHEFGGTTKPHVIRPRNAKALAWRGIGPGKEGGGNFMVFAKVVNHPGSKIPARPYLRPAAESTKDKIMQNFGIFLSLSFTKRGE